MKDMNYLVGTGNSNTLLPAGTKVLKKFGDGYVPVDISSLKVGDGVLERADWADVNLERIDRVQMSRSLTYRAAKEGTHFLNTHKEYIPKLRVHLLEGLVEAELAERHERIYQEDELDFERRQYGAFKDTVQEVLGDWDVKYSGGGVLQWLHGGVVAPVKNWGALAALSEINPVFAAFYDSFEQPEGFHNDVLTYRGVRRVLRRYITRLKEAVEKGEAPDKPTDALDKLSRHKRVFAREIEYLLEDIGDKIQRGYIPSVVTDISEVVEGELVDKEQPNQKISRGIATESAGVEIKSLQQLIDEFNLIQSIALLSINQFSQSYSSEERDIAALAKYPILEKYLGKENPMLKKTLEHYHSSVSRLVSRKFKREAPKKAREFFRRLKSGQHDNSINVPVGSTERLFDLMAEYATLLPNQFFLANTPNPDDVFSGDFNKYEASILEKDYGVKVLSKVLLQSALDDTDKMMGIGADQSLVSSLQTKEKQIRLYNKSQEIYTLAETEHLLASHNLSQLINLLHPRGFPETLYD